MFLLSHVLGFGELGICQFCCFRVDSWFLRYRGINTSVFLVPRFPTKSVWARLSVKALSHLVAEWGWITTPQNLTSNGQVCVLQAYTCLSASVTAWFGTRPFTSLSLSFPVCKMRCGILGWAGLCCSNKELQNAIIENNGFCLIHVACPSPVCWPSAASCHHSHTQTQAVVGGQNSVAEHTLYLPPGCETHHFSLISLAKQVPWTQVTAGE